MNRNKIYDFCERHGVSKMDIHYRNKDVELSMFGLGSGPTPEASLVNLSIIEPQLLEVIENEAVAMAFIEQDRKEKELREKYPAVKKAYDEYVLLLKLTQKENE